MKYKANILSNAQKKEIGWQPEIQLYDIVNVFKIILYLHKQGMIIGLSIHQRYVFYFKGTNPILQDMLRNGKSMVCLSSLATRSGRHG